MGLDIGQSPPLGKTFFTFSLSEPWKDRLPLIYYGYLYLCLAKVYYVT